MLKPGPSKPVQTQRRGLTLIELMVGLAIMAMLMMTAAPSLSTWAHNGKIRLAAESMLSGLQYAKSEAVTRNARVRFQLTSTMDNSCRLSSSGQNWVANLDPDADVTTVSGHCGAAPSDTAAPWILKTRSAAEGSGAAVVSTDAPTASVVFNGLGRLSPQPANDMHIDVTDPAGGNCTAAGGDLTCLRIVINPTGVARMCNPNMAGDDPQGC